MANYTDPDEVLTDQSARITTPVWVLIAALPAAYLLTWLVQRRTLALRDNVALRRRGRALSSARRTLAAANGTPDHARAAGAILGYIADRCNAPTGGMTRADAAGLLADRNVPETVARQVDDLLASAEKAQYAGAADTNGDRLISTAGTILTELERLRLK